MSAIPTRKKKVQKVPEGETCVSPKLQSRRERGTNHESERGSRLRKHVLEISASGRATDVSKAAEVWEEAGREEGVQ